jgi:hypothetical protein
VREDLSGKNKKVWDRICRDSKCPRDLTWAEVSRLLNSIGATVNERSKGHFLIKIKNYPHVLTVACVHGTGILLPKYVLMLRKAFEELER